MAKDKTSFVLYSDNKSVIDLLTNEQAGILLKTLFAYVNDENPIIDESIKLVFEMIKLQLKRDLKKWENTINERSINGRKGNLKKYNLDLFKLFEQGKYTLEEAEEIAKSRKSSQPDSSASVSVANVAVNDSVSVSVNDSVSVSDIIINNNNYVVSCLESEQWLETICMAKKITTEQCKEKLKEFEQHLIITADQKQNKKEFQSHFSNWLVKGTSINAIQNPNGIGKTNQKLMTYEDD